MPGLQSSNQRVPLGESASEAPYFTILIAVICIGICVLLFMATLALGPSGFGFGLVMVAAIFSLMAHRYRFSLRTFLLVVTVLSVWLGLKLDRDLRLRKSLTAMTNADGHLKVLDRTPNFPGEFGRITINLISTI
jgi:hypothetical protein